ncbi:triose-phosphate isomerase [Nitrosococcus oceani]|uniref:Triosephosphate isomerase n=2 Tax=Nitrosococcus oceani TaxID=1229 RepID=TPIS_NITOC|nr:triose-phosphate isomerase [Nitrosococcus oceani]Q3J827.1 RecName: Full=Triosephosphate isomerase; Short=TIM; Short=TPI; AltName: Full=Triose-phosphate isomerase [Nitrosococcus oceani ATCC 19707]KFI18542.1 triosephosphate isomerase [Nitrosococcus oceani C-27]ABA59019.1 triosephosphate isomerase [Nitrosococcus oceani ATCC 19707]KFI21770.1 triosephosphate isomerase [Nitrosococcus oceani]GEM21218.1 triose-phosphate isomerase [Nitrosococcus oceani]
MRTPLVVGNWKMNGSRAANRALLESMRKEMEAGVTAEVAVCPPFVYLADMESLLQGSVINWGAQNLSHHEVGAYTGEIAPSMLADLGCRFVIVGHSERRTLYGETDSLVAEKAIVAQKVNIIPIICVGETLQEREQNITEQVVKRQLNAVLELAGVNALEKAVIAYEPIWAIGTGRTATPEQAQEVHALIRSHVAIQNSGIAEELLILYGGSVKGNNAAELLAMPDIDGGLIGGASLDAKEFLTICQAAG